MPLWMTSLIVFWTNMRASVSYHKYKLIMRFPRKLKQCIDCHEVHEGDEDAIFNWCVFSSWSSWCDNRPIDLTGTFRIITNNNINKQEKWFDIEWQWKHFLSSLFFFWAGFWRALRQCRISARNKPGPVARNVSRCMPDAIMYARVGFI